MEKLTYNSLGQWTLHKADPTKRDYKDFHGRKDGQLTHDYDQKGKLHAFANRRPQPQMSDHRLKGEVPTPKISAYQSQNPSLEDDSESPKIDRI